MYICIIQWNAPSADRCIYMPTW